MNNLFGPLESIIHKFTSSVENVKELTGGLHANFVQGKPFYPHVVYNFVTGQVTTAFLGSSPSDAEISMIVKGKDYRDTIRLTDLILKQLYRDEVIRAYTLNPHTFQSDDKVYMIALQVMSR